MTKDELKEFANKIEILSRTADKSTLIKLGSIKGRVDEIFERYIENKKGY